MKCPVVQLKTMLLLVTLCSVAVVLVIGCSPATTSEPRYNGRTLSEWLVEYEAAGRTNGTRETNAMIVIRAIGSNAAPFLVKWINVDYTELERIMSFLAFASGKGGYEPPRIKQSNRAMRAFQILGTNAAPAIPGLTKIILEDKQYGAVIEARYALLYIGPPGVTALGMLATNRSTPRRSEVIETFELRNETGPRDMAKSFLTNCLSDPDPKIRDAATGALEAIARDDERRAKAR